MIGLVFTYMKPFTMLIVWLVPKEGFGFHEPVVIPFRKFFLCYLSNLFSFKINGNN